MSEAGRRSLAFGPFRLEPDDRLLSQGAPVHVPPKELAVLRLLAEAGGRVVLKEEIFERVWPGVAVSDSSLTRCIRSIRAALGERGRQGSYIETLHGRGYRFAAPVHDDTNTGPDAAGSRRLLVAPLENAGGKPDDEYLCDGLTGELIDEIGRRVAPRLGVIARHTAMRCKGLDPTAAARELAVGFVLAGTVERRDETIRVRVELVRTSDLVQVWSARFERRAERAARLAPEIAAALAEYLRSEAAREARRDEALTGVHTSRLRARNAYLEGRFLATLRTEDGIRKALERFRQAAAWEPEFPLAYVGFADAHLMLAFRGFVPPLEAAAIVRQSLDCAFAIDPELPSAFTTLGQLRLQIDWDPVGAEAALRRALELEPGQPAACVHLGSLLNAHWRFEEAIAVRRAGLELDPFSPLLRLGMGFSLGALGRTDDALACARELTRSEPDFPAGYALHAFAAHQAGARDEALAAAETGSRIASGEPITLSGCAWVEAACGRRAAARGITEKLAREAEGRSGGAAFVALAYAGLEDDEEALAWLEQARRERSMYLPLLGADPRCARLRGSPRFREIIEVAGGRVEPAGR
ncbi:MAG TPA: winged helix-turn-helix domain-containing protein [Myxococcota bacterium]|jgi:DNA-binding winged helix-turn-helix (wHTH) protein/tetratricopeptide (TPR) repeat protein|nr:winged helix-turn-helix domain-containing protein [Myxococcota bacterium]